MPEAVSAARARITEIAEEMAKLRDERRSLAKSVVGEVLDQLAAIAGQLQATKGELRGMAERLPAAEPDEEADDEASQLRTTIECVVADALDPAIENLEKAVQSRRPAMET